MVQGRAKCPRDTSGRLDPAPLGQPGTFRGSLGSDYPSSPIYTSGPALTRMAEASIALPRGAWQRGGDISSLFSTHQAKEEHITPALGQLRFPGIPSGTTSTKGCG